jgi:hypothetical protein
MRARFFVPVLLLLVAASAAATTLSDIASAINRAPLAERQLAIELLRRKALERRHPLLEEAAKVSCATHEIMDQDGAASFIELASERSPLSGLVRAMNGQESGSARGKGENKVRHNRALTGESGKALGAERSMLRAPSQTSDAPSSGSFTGHFPGDVPSSSPIVGCTCSDYECTCAHSCQCKILGDDGAVFLDPSHSGPNGSPGNSTLSFLPSVLLSQSGGKPVIPSSTRIPGHMFRCDCRFHVEGTQGKMFDSLACGCEPEQCQCKRSCSCPKVDSS